MLLVIEIAGGIVLAAVILAVLEGIYRSFHE